MTKLDPENNYNAIVHYDDGTTVNVFSTHIRLKGLNYFKGWKCKAGVERIFISSDLNVFSSQCENDFLGNLKHESFELINDFTTCKQQRCGNNPDDIMMEKYLPDINDNN
jgi:MoaA/NifB/PqqE/SkfB family radical SAM enzyme